MSFSLSKWYLDVVTPDGVVAIAYWAEVRYGSLRQPFAGVLVRRSEDDTSPWHFAARSVLQPRIADDRLEWDSESLELAGEYTRSAPAFEQRIYEEDDGVIDWHCVVPRGAVRMRVGDTVLEGTGYVERLELTIQPWKIPADEIRWGRYIDDDGSVVWIDWHGESPRSLVYCNGRSVFAETVTDSQVRFGGAQQLDLADARVITDDNLGDLLAPLAKLRPLVEPISRTHQTRWLSHGVLRGGGPATRSGWALHEVIRRR